MNLKFWQNNKEQDKGFVPYEEINEKKTSLLGYFFLVLMVFFGFYQGQSFLEEVEDSVDVPMRNSNCLISIDSFSNLNKNNQYDSYYRHSSYFSPSNTVGDSSTGCGEISAREYDLGLEILYEQVGPINIRITELQRERTNLEQTISSLSIQRGEGMRDYQTALVEDLAEVDGVLESEDLGSAVASQEQEIARLQQQVEEINSEINNLSSKLVSLTEPYRTKIIAAQKKYVNEMRIYEFKKFLYTFLFVAPIFWLVWRKYSIAKERRSEYVIIWGGLVATFGLIFAQILLVFFYKVLPHELIIAIFTFLGAFEFLWVILKWLSFILIPLFFGMMIYFIQKKLYNKKAVLFRTIKSGSCPQCTLKISPHMNNCPICGYQLKDKCYNCGNMTLKDGEYCEICGVKKPIAEVVNS